MYLTLWVYEVSTYLVVTFEKLLNCLWVVQDLCFLLCHLRLVCETPTLSRLVQHGRNTNKCSHLVAVDRYATPDKGADPRIDRFLCLPHLVVVESEGFFVV